MVHRGEHRADERPRVFTQGNRADNVFEEDEEFNFGDGLEDINWGCRTARHGFDHMRGHGRGGFGHMRGHGRGGFDHTRGHGRGFAYGPGGFGRMGGHGRGGFAHGQGVFGHMGGHGRGGFAHRCGENGNDIRFDLRGLRGCFGGRGRCGFMDRGRDFTFPGHHGFGNWSRGSRGGFCNRKEWS